MYFTLKKTTHKVRNVFEMFYITLSKYFNLFSGGIMFEGEIGGKNVNQLALMQGLAVPNPAIIGKQPFPVMIPGPGFGPRPPMRPMPHQEWDADYLEYGGVGRQGPNPGMMNNQRMPLRRPKNAVGFYYLFSFIVQILLLPQ